MLGYKSLVEVIHKNDLQGFKSILNNVPCNVNDAEEDTGLTLLMVASAQGQLDFPGLG